MARRVFIKLRFHRASRRLCKTIGMALGNDGLPKKKVWYFDPDDEAASIQKVVELRARWKKLRSEGKVVWDQDPEFQQQQSDNVERPIKPKPLTVADASAMYIEQLQQQQQAGQMSESHFLSQLSRLRQSLFPLIRLPLSIVGEQQLRAAILRLAQRPVLELRRLSPRSGRPHSKPPKTRRMSAAYSRNSISTLKWFWTWCDESELVEWRKPSLFRAIFKARPMLTIEERQRELGATEVEHFTLDELTKLWHEASSFQRTLILLGLNCAFGNGECSTLRCSEVRGLGSEQPFIERYRQKTMKSAGKGSYGKWYLWPETVAHLELHRAPDNAGRLWLLTEEGLMLTRHNATGQSWRRLVARAHVRMLTFKYLRKTSAHLIRNTLGYGREIADMMLAHADGGMVRHYAGRDWDGRLREATLKLRTLLLPMIAPPPRSPDASESSREVSSAVRDISVD